MNIMYYGVQTKGPDSIGVTIGPVTITIEQVNLCYF